MIVILLLGGRKIEIRESDLAAMTGRQIVKRLTDDGVIVHLELMTIFEHESGRRLRRFGSGLGVGLGYRRVLCDAGPVEDGGT